MSLLRYVACLNLFLIVGVLPVRADHYVAQAGQTPSSPYTSWSAAASNIQDAVNVAANGATIWVSNGVYRLPTNAVTYVGTNIVYLTNAIILRSVNGPATTLIDGEGSNRCFYVNMSAAACTFGPCIIDGFTFTNGFNYHRGGGGYLAAVAGGAGTCIVQNCVFANNLVRNDSSDSPQGGGGLFTYHATMSFMVSNCIFRGNRAETGSVAIAYGGGLLVRTAGVIVDSAFYGNYAYNYGGGVYTYLVSTTAIIERCMFSNNASLYGGGFSTRYNSRIGNSLFVDNFANYGGGIHVYNGIATIYNCTVMNNTTNGVRLRYDTSGVNVAMFNNIVSGLVVESSNVVVTGYNNCLSGLPTYGTWYGTIITNDPGVVSLSGKDYHLKWDSPCVNAGTNFSGIGTLDLDRWPRIDRLTGLPDIGCYEYVPRGLVVKMR